MTRHILKKDTYGVTQYSNNQKLPEKSNELWAKANGNITFHHSHIYFSIRHITHSARPHNAHVMSLSVTNYENNL